VTALIVQCSASAWTPAAIQTVLQTMQAAAIYGPTRSTARYIAPSIRHSFNNQQVAEQGCQ